MTPTAVYADRERLATAVRSITARFGGDVLADARRTRNLLLDEYGPSGVSQRADIDTFVDAISGDLDLPVTAFAADAASRLAARGAMTEGDAHFTVDLVRTVTTLPVPAGQVGRAPLPPPDRFMRTGGGSDLPGDPGSGGPRRRSTRLVPVLAASTTVALLAAIAILVVSAGRVADARDDAQAVRDELSRANSAAAEPSSADDQDASDRESRRLLDEKAALESDVAELQAKVDTLEASKEQTITSLTTLREPFGLGPTQIPPSASEFTGQGGEVECVGIKNDDCSDTWYLSGRMVSEGGQMYFDSSAVAKVPLASLDGLNWSGEGAVTAEAGHTCGDQPKPTAMRISLAPAQFVADPTTKSITVTAYVATWTFSTQQALGCGASAVTYTATLFAN